MGNNKEISINLLEAEQHVRGQKIKAAAGLSLVLVLMTGIMIGQHAHGRQQIETLKQENIRLNQSCDDTRILLEDREEEEISLEQLNRKSQRIQRLRNGIASKLEVLDAIEATIPAELDLTEIVIEDDRVMVKGVASAYGPEVIWLNSIGGTPLLKEIISIDSGRKAKEEGVSFELVLARGDD